MNHLIPSDIKISRNNSQQKINNKILVFRGGGRLSIGGKKDILHTYLHTQNYVADLISQGYKILLEMRGLPGQ